MPRFHSIDLPIVPSVAIALFTSLLAAPAAHAQAPDLPDATTILAKVDARMGDAAARKALRTLVVRGVIEIPDSPGGGKFEAVWLGADHVKESVDWGGGAAMTQGTTGAFSWSTDPALGVTIREGDEQASVRRMFELGRRAAWSTLYTSATTKGSSDLDGRPHFELTMQPAVGNADTWIVDRETYELDAVDMALPDPMGGELSVRYLFADYRDVQGIRFPFSKTMKVGTVQIRYRCESIQPNAAVKAEQVAPSEAVLEAVKDPKRRSHAVPADPTACTLEELTAQPTLTIRVTIAANAVSRTLAVILPEVGGVLSEVGGEMAGPPFSRFHSDDGKTIDLEAGMTVKKRVEGKGRVKASELPAGETAITWHVGPYNTLPKTYARLEEWMKSQILTSDGGHWEVYWTDPGIEPDPSKWRTRVHWPVK